MAQQNEISPRTQYKADQLYLKWSEAYAEKEREDLAGWRLDQLAQQEESAWDELVDFVEAEDLNGTGWDPRILPASQRRTVRHCALTGKHRPHQFRTGATTYQCPGRMLPVA